MSRSSGRQEKLRQEKSKNKKEHWNMKNPTFEVGVFHGHVLTIELGKFWDYWPKPAHPLRLQTCSHTYTHTHIYIYIYIYISPGELPHYPHLTRFGVTPLSTWELPHYPRQFCTVKIAIWEVLGLFQLCSAVSRNMWVLVMVFLNMLVGGLKKRPVFDTAGGQFL